MPHAAGWEASARRTVHGSDRESCQTVQVWWKLLHQQQTRSSNIMNGNGVNRNLRSGVDTPQEHKTPQFIPSYPPQVSSLLLHQPQRPSEAGYVFSAAFLLAGRSCGREEWDDHNFSNIQQKRWQHCLCSKPWAHFLPTGRMTKNTQPEVEYRKEALTHTN